MTPPTKLDTQVEGSSAILEPSITFDISFAGTDTSDEKIPSTLFTPSQNPLFPDIGVADIVDGSQQSLLEQKSN